MPAIEPPSPKRGRRPRLKRREPLPLPPEPERTPEWEDQYLDNLWLGLGDVASLQTKDPFAAGKDQDPAFYVLGLMSRPEYFSFTCKWLLNKVMYPFQLAVLAELWVRPFPMLLASRGAGKSFMLAVYAVLRAVFNQGSKIVVIGAAFRQAKVIYEYIVDIWENAPILRGLVGAHNDRRQGPKRDIDRCTVRIGTSMVTACPLGDGCVSPNTLTTYGDRFGQVSDNADVIAVTKDTPGVSIWGNGRMRSTTESYYNGVRETYIVETKSGFKYEATGNHKMKVVRSGQTAWARTDDVKKGDRVPIDRSERWHSGASVASVEEAHAVGTAAAVGKGPLPASMLAADKATMAACLRGVFEARGRVRTTTFRGGDATTIDLVVASESLARQVQYVLLHYGIVAALSSRNGPANEGRVHELSIVGDDARRFAARIGPAPPGGRGPFGPGPEVAAAPDVYHDEVKSITRGRSHTFDVLVPDGHEFCAGGFFSHNSRIRGLRANVLISDEFASIPVDVFETVVRGFAAVSADPIASAKQASRRRGLKDLGKWSSEMDEVDGDRLTSNQTIVSGTASYAWNHFHKYWKRYKAIVESRGDPKTIADIFDGKVPRGFDWRDFSVIRIPFDLLPEGYMDEKSIAQAKATIDVGTYLAEYGCCFIQDTIGFFRRTLIESCVAGGPNGPLVLPSCGEVEFDSVLRGVPGRRYVFGVDPASLADNLAIVVLELWDDHRRIVHVWTTNKSRHVAIKNAGLSPEHDYYRFCARKIRDLMKAFPCVHLALDAQGGGDRVLEALGDPDKLKPGERPLHPIVDPDRPQHTDALAGEHIVELVQFANAKYVWEANHGLKKDLEDKALLFPSFNAAKVAVAFEEDKQAGRSVEGPDGAIDRLYDTLEDCMLDTEELKNELSTIECRPTPNGTDRWDTPEIKVPGQKKGRLRKDRYSALLMANMAARRMERAPEEPNYFQGGGFARDQAGQRPEGPLYSGPSWYVDQAGAGYGAVVRR